MIRRRLDALEQATLAPTIEKRDPAGTVRVRVGRHPDGKWGVRVMDAGGSVTSDQTTNP